MIVKIVCAAIITLGSSVALAQTVNPWRDITYEDPVTQQQVAGIELNPDANSDGDLGNTDLIIRCKDSYFQIILLWDQQLEPTVDPNNPTFPVEYRSGDNDAQQDNWGILTSLRGVVYAGNTINLLQNLESNAVFIANVQPLGSMPITATFDTTGIDDAVKPVLTACGFNQK